MRRTSLQSLLDTTPPKRVPVHWDGLVPAPSIVHTPKGLESGPTCSDQKLPERLGAPQSGRNGHSRRLMLPGGNDNFNDGTGVGVCQSQTSAEFTDALSHPADADSNAFRPQLNHLLFNSLAIVAHSDHDVALTLGDTDSTIPRSGMPEHIGQGLLDDAKNSSLHLRPEPPKIRWLDLEVNFNSAAL